MIYQYSVDRHLSVTVTGFSRDVRLGLARVSHCVLQNVGKFRDGRELATFYRFKQRPSWPRSCLCFVLRIS